MTTEIDAVPELTSCPGVRVTDAEAEDDKGSVEYPARKMATWKLHRRWDRAGRLLGEPAMKTLGESHVIVFGLGGVGSFAAESLARTGLGKLTLVDFDRVCGTNANRQLHTMKGTYGKYKADLMAERCSLINPECTVIGRRAFYRASTSEALLLDAKPDFVIDAIDNITAKVHLLMTCLEHGIPVVSCMGAAGKLDPMAVNVADITQSHQDPLAKAVRRILREKGLAVDPKTPLGIPTVFSTETRHAPQHLSYDGTAGFTCICPTKDNKLHACEHRNLIEGTASFVTGTFGLVAASVVVRTLSGR